MIHIALINPKDVTNVGSALRAIGCYQADGLFYTGNRYETARRYRTDTNAAHETTHVEHVAAIPEAIAKTLRKHHF